MTRPGTRRDPTHGGSCLSGRALVCEGLRFPRDWSVAAAGAAVHSPGPAALRKRPPRSRPFRAFGFAAFAVALFALLPVLPRASASDLPRFLLPDPEMEELLNDLFVRHLRATVSDSSLRRDGWPNPGDGLTLWTDWEVTQLHWFDDTKRNFPLEDLRAQFVNRINNTPVDRFGYVWSVHNTFETPTAGPGVQFGQGWPFPTYLDGGNPRAGAEWNRNSLEGWKLRMVTNIRVEDGWLQFTSSGPLPELCSPVIDIDASQMPFLEMDFALDEVIPPDRYIRWLRVDWSRGEKGQWTNTQRVELKDFATLPPVGLRPRYRYRFYFPMYLHPEWQGKIHQIRIEPFTYWGRAFGKFRFNYVRLGYDTRHAANNPTWILAAWRYFLWTGDRSFLQRNLPNMRRALLFLNHHLEGKTKRMLDQRPFFPGHDAFGSGPDGEPNPGHGIGTNWFDTLGLGSRDLLSNILYIRALEAMARAEEFSPLPAVEGLRRPAVSVADGTGEIVYEETAESLRRLAAEVRERVRSAFWNPATGRFAGGIDRDGNLVDYGFTAQNLEALAIGLPTSEEARSILDWLDGKRIVEGDTSQAGDIYFWRFAPRTTTRRNEDHYVWTVVNAMRRSDLAFGEQVQDGGAVLWESYYDVLGRVRNGDVDGAWKRLEEILRWHRDVRERGGKGAEFYRKAYPTGDPLEEGPEIRTPWDGLLDGGGARGGLGLDADYIENSIVPVSILSGFLGVDVPEPNVFEIHPRIPEGVEYLGVTNIARGKSVVDVRAGNDWVDLAGSELRAPDWSLRIRFEPGGKGEPAVTRDGEPYASFETAEDGTVIVTDRDASPHRYEVHWKTPE